jgi:hypothetical protein
MHKILIYLHIIQLLKSSTCFEHYPAHHQEVYVVIVYMQPLVSSLSAGDCLVHRLRKDFLNRCTGQALEEGEWSASRPGRSLPPGKTRYPLYRWLGGLQGRSEQVQKILLPTGSRPPDRPARSQSLYTLRYPAHWHPSSSVIFQYQVRGFAPGRSRRIFLCEKILSTPSFGGEVKPSVPCRSFTAC